MHLEALPHISASEPSALNIRIRKSAVSRTHYNNESIAANAEMAVTYLSGKVGRLSE